MGVWVLATTLVVQALLITVPTERNWFWPHLKGQTGAVEAALATRCFTEPWILHLNIKKAQFNRDGFDHPLMGSKSVRTFLTYYLTLEQENIFPPHEGFLWSKINFQHSQSASRQKKKIHIFLFLVIFSLKHFLEGLFKIKINELQIYEPSLKSVSLIIPGGPSY